jgi:hypothetical protein
LGPWRWRSRGKPPDDFPSHQPAYCVPAGGGRRLFANHPTAKQNQDAIRDRNQLIELARNQEHADAAVPRLPDLLVDRGDGANVQPPRRLRCEKKDQRRDREFTRENRLLLIAPERLAILAWGPEPRTS